jgi:ABC-type glycerol-3-phosphate transport system substrate-binding protein
MSKKLGIVAAVLACAVLAATAAQAQSDKRHETVTINFMTYVWQPTTVAATKKIVDSWNASHPDIKVNEVKIDPNTVHDYMVTNFAGGTTPDIVHDEAADLAGFVSQGYIADLKPLLPKSLKSSIPKRVWDSVTYDGKVAAVPTLLQTYNVFANVDALKAAGVKLPTIEHPWTWAQFRAAAKKLTRGGNYGVGWGLRSPVSATVSMALNFDGQFFYKQGGKTVVKVGKGEGEFLQTVHDMIWDDKSIDSAGVGLSGGGVLPGFFAGKYAMTIQGNYSAQQMILEAPKSFHWALLPLLKGTSQDQMANPQTYSIAAQSKHKKEAMQFLAYLANAQNMARLAQGDWLIPVNPAAGKKLVKSTKHYGSWKVAIKSLPALRAHPLLELQNYPKWKSQIAQPALQSYFQNKTSLAELRDALQKGWDQVNQ